MRLYLDTEFNGHGGELISIALAGDDGTRFYAEAPEPRVWDAWVNEHVYPLLDHTPEPMQLLRARLKEYLQHRDGAEIYADWPQDFEHLMQLMRGDSYDASWLAECSMILLRESDPRPERPHNALSDAEALMRWHQQQEG